MKRKETEANGKNCNHIYTNVQASLQFLFSTKYWSIIGSAVGALIGIVGTTVNNRLRMRELRSLVTESNDTAKMNSVIQELSDTIQTQHSHVRSFVSDLREIFQLGKVEFVEGNAESQQLLSSGTGIQQSAEILSAIERQNSTLAQEMNEVKQLIAVDRGYQVGQEGTIVYVGPEMTSLLDRTERNLEWKMKISTLVNVVMVYGALAIAIPIILAISKGAE